MVSSILYISYVMRPREKNNNYYSLYFKGVFDHSTICLRKILLASPLQIEIAVPSVVLATLRVTSRRQHMRKWRDFTAIWRATQVTKKTRILFKVAYSPKLGRLS